MNNPFDKKLELWKGLPTEVRDAATFVTDTLDLSWAAAQAVFGDRATPEAALGIYDRIVDRMAWTEGEGHADEATEGQN